MYLENIKKTNDIKKLNLKEKEVLAQEIRDYLIDVTSKNGGHLASNLGSVELTLALHSVFDVKKDRIIWDVGHQSYTHKILTGRNDALKSIRTFGGISGFPKYNEDVSDAFDTGHSSTSISAAMGMSVARDLQKKDYHVIAVIGDGALTGGMALEALNHTGWTNTRMIVILNDNEMSISKNASGINKLLTGLRTKRKYRISNEKGKKFALKIPYIGKKIVKIIDKSKGAMKKLILPGMYFEEIGLRYLGPVDGHNIQELEHILNKVKYLDGPTLIHVRTKKGKGYKPAEENPDKFHGVGKFNKETGEIVSSGLNYSKVFGNKLCDLAKKNKKIVAITAAMKDGTGLGNFANKYPDRFFDVGIAEQHALTFAAGLARQGMIPVVSIYSSFYQRAIDQVIHDICMPNLPVIMCVDRAGIVGADGETHQGLYDMSIFRVVPNIEIMCPKDFRELENMLEYAITLKKPCVIRYPRGGEQIPFDKHEKLNHTGELLVKGDDVTIIGIGNSVAKCYNLCNELAKNNISADVINTRFLKPLDSKLIINSIKKTKKVIVIEENTIYGGLSTYIKELIIDKKLNDISIKCFSYPDEFIVHGSVLEIEKKYKFDEKSILKECLKFIKR